MSKTIMLLKRIAVMLTLLVLVLFSFMPLPCVNAEESWDDTVEFDSRQEVEEKFVAHFASVQNSRRADKLDFSWDLSGGTLKRINNVASDKDTVNIAILTYVGNVYDDFEMSVDFKTGTMTSYWPVVGIRQQIPGKYYTTVGGGAGIFMQQNGKITAWGPIIAGYIVEQNISTVSAYYPAMWHNLKIRAEGSNVEVFVDGNREMRISVAGTDYPKGYISLQSVNNDCEFDNFKIRALNVGQNGANEENKYEGANEGTHVDELMN